MQHRQRLESNLETLLDFVVAAEEKYWEGVELATCNRNAASIYLLGYAAEMYLKVAAFRVDGAAPLDLVSPKLLPVRRWMAANQPGVEHEGYHSVIFWMEYLRSRRSSRGVPLARNLDGSLVHHVKRIYSIWWVEMRYRPDQASAEETDRLIKDVSWLRSNQQTIWR
jgi:hypothetical protein